MNLFELDQHTNQTQERGEENGDDGTAITFENFFKQLNLSETIFYTTKNHHYTEADLAQGGKSNVHRRHEEDHGSCYDTGGAATQETQSTTKGMIC